MRTIPIALGAVASLLAFGATAAQGSTSGTTYVSPHGHAGGSDHSCGTARYSDINAAIAATSTGGTVVVCRGRYDTQAVVAKPLNLAGRPGATINATGQPPLKVGPGTLPGSVGIAVLGTSHVRVSGFTVGHAGFDAILIARSSHVWASGNELLHNGDVGVDINGSSWSWAVGNVAKDNMGGGFLVADDVGPNSHNVIAWNVATDNPGGCGVILAGHSTAGVTGNAVDQPGLPLRGRDGPTGVSAEEDRLRGR